MTRLDPHTFGLEAVPGVGEVWLTATWQAERAGELLDPAIGLACSPDGALVRHDAGTGDAIAREAGTPATARGAVVAPDGRHALVPSADPGGGFAAFAFVPGQPAFVLAKADGQVSAATFYRE